MARVLVLALLAAAWLAAADAAYESAAAKIASIENDQVPAGSSVWLGLEEVNAYCKAAALEAVPQGLRDPRLELASGGASAFAWIDFLKVREIKGEAGSLEAWLLSGEKPLKVAARIQSARGRATVDVDEVTISGITVRGVLLDFLIEKFLLPLYPDAKIGQPFLLKHNVDRLEISTAGVRIIMAAPR